MLPNKINPNPNQTEKGCRILLGLIPVILLGPINSIVAEKNFKIIIIYMFIAIVVIMDNQNVNVLFGKGILI